MTKNGRAVVTGGSRGIGLAIVEKLIHEGYFVEFTYLNSIECSELLQEKYLGACRGTRVDGSNPEEVRQYVNELYNSSEPVSLLVNNAGITKDLLVKDACWEDYKEIMEVNFGGVFNFCNLLLPRMMKQKYGDIINISSQACGNVRIGNSFYASSKCAIERFSKTLAIESIRFNVAVNIVAPGFVETDLVKAMLNDPKTKKDLLRQIPTRKFTKPEEVAEAVILLIKRQPLLIGVTIPIGGGAHLN
jgi:NAD(P)-dependent dehydrogenase (short-subunit alcohol dehydrogenase family)